MRSMTDYWLECSDCLKFLGNQAADSISLIFGSPPYSGKCRRYGAGSRLLRGKDWARWMLEVYQASVRCCTGLVAFVIDSGTREFRWDAAPAHLMALLDEAGLHQFHPSVYYRTGVPGSGGPCWFRNDAEFVICCHRPGRLPWANPLATAQPPKFPVGGGMSNRQEDGERTPGKKPYRMPELANPGNVHRLTVGGGHLGHPLAHDNEAPMPLALAEIYVRSFCPPGGIVLDPFLGSGTTLHAALLHDCPGMGCDNRPEQIDLCRQRLTDVLGTLAGTGVHS